MKWIIVLTSLLLTSCAKDMLEFNPYTTVIKQIYMEAKKVKWTIDGYYFDGRQTYIIYKNEQGQTKMKLTKQL